MDGPLLPRPSFRLLFLSVVLTLPFGSASGQSEPTVTFGGQIRPRAVAREPVRGQWDHWTSMRTRIALDARFQDGLLFSVQVQDVRFWGGETSSRDVRGDAVDFYQAFIEVEDLPGVGGGVRVGRQEVDLGEGRFIAAPNWGQGGQSFDGFRWIRPVGGGNLNILYLRLREGTSPTHEQSADLSTAWLTYPLGTMGMLDVMAIHDRYRETTDTDRTTIGSTLKRDDGALTFRIQGAYQFGERFGRDVSAFMVAAQGTAEVVEDQAAITLWYDHLSGDGDPLDSTDNAFSNLFSARHRFYGHADYFRVIPEDLDGLGLRDLALKLAVTPSALLSLGVDLHTFRTAATGELTTTHLGEELDIWAEYRFRNAMDLEAGYSLTIAGSAMEELGLLEGTGHTLYLMTSLAF
jgi:hypothetical protein